MPRLGWTMEEGTLVEWLKADGDTVEAGENPLYGGKRQGPQRDRDLLRRHLVHSPGRAPARRYRAGGHPAWLSVAARRGNADRAGPNARRRAGSNACGTRACSKTRAGPNPCASPFRRADHQSSRPARGLGARGGMARAHRQRPHGPDRRARCPRGCRPQWPSGPAILTTEADATELVTLRPLLKAEGAPAPAYHHLIAKLVVVVLAEHPQLNAAETEASISASP